MFQGEGGKVKIVSCDKNFRTKKALLIRFVHNKEFPSSESRNVSLTSFPKITSRDFPVPLCKPQFVSSLLFFSPNFERDWLFNIATTKEKENTGKEGERVLLLFCRNLRSHLLPSFPFSKAKKKPRIHFLPMGLFSFFPLENMGKLEKYAPW